MAHIENRQGIVNQTNRRERPGSHTRVSADRSKNPIFWQPLSNRRQTLFKGPAMLCGCHWRALKGGGGSGTSKQIRKGLFHYRILVRVGGLYFFRNRLIDDPSKPKLVKKNNLFSVHIRFSLLLYRSRPLWKNKRCCREPDLISSSPLLSSEREVIFSCFYLLSFW